VGNQINREELQRELARRSFKYFVKKTKPDYHFNWHHEIMCQKLQDFASGKIKRLMLFAPPRHGKTELVSRRLPPFLFGQNKNCKIISTSYGAELSSTVNRDVQRIIDSQSYIDIFPEVALSSSNVRTAAKGNWMRNNDVFEIVGTSGSYRCAGVGGAITGLGGDYLIIDDPIKNYEEAKSPTIRRKVWEWYTSTLYTRQEKDAGILIIQTRWNESDLSGILLEEMKKGGEFADQWEVISFPALLEYQNDYDPRNVGDALWPWKYDERFLKVTKATLGSFQFNALYQQNPTPDEGAYVKTSWLKYYDQLPAKFDEIIQSWDMSFGSTSESASFVVGSIYGRNGAEIYLIDQVRKQMDFVETISEVQRMTARHPLAIRKLIEKKANGQAVIDILGKKIQGMIPIEPDSSKESRFASCQPLYEAGNVFYPSQHLKPWIADHVDEIVGFPNAKFNDRVDTESQALNYFRRSGIGEFTKDMAQLKPSGLGLGSAKW